MIRFWTAADTKTVSSTIGKALKALKPNVPPHKFEAFDPQWIPQPEAGEVVMVCGTKPLDVLKKNGIFKKQFTLNKLRESPVKAAKGGWYLTTFDPSICANEPDKADIIAWDIQLALRLLTNGHTKPILGNYEWVGSYQPLIDEIEAIYEETGEPVPVSLDTETMGLHPWYADRSIVCCAFTLHEGTAQCLYTGPGPDPVPVSQNLREQVVWLLTSPKVSLRLANGKYDMIWIAERWGIECTNFKFDTLLVGTLLDENRSNSLKLHAKTMTPLGGYDDELTENYDMGHMEQVPLDVLCTYQGCDTDVTQRVATQMREQLLEDKHLATFYVTILHPAARAFEKIERRGVLVDQEAYAQLGDDLRKEIKTLTDGALELLPNKLRIKFMDKIEDQITKGASPFTPAILQEFYFGPTGLNLKPIETTAKTGAPSTAKSHLKMFMDHPEAGAMTKILEEMGSAQKTLGTYVDGFLKHLRPDGRFHPSYMLFRGGFNDDEDDDSGTVTGRTSCKDPAFQTIPKKTKWAKRLRKCYIAPPGKVILLCDYSQGELRVVACVANEKQMIKAYKDGLDLHAVTGAKLGGATYEEFLSWKNSEDAKLKALFDDFRTRAKAGNFGLLYGMGVNGFIAYAWANYGLKLSQEEAEQIRNDFFTLYPGLTTYHETSRSLAHNWQEVRSPLGRIRHLPMIKSWDKEVVARAERQAINSPIQSCLSDMMLWAIARIEALGDDRIECVGMIHDACMYYVPEHEAKECAAIIQETMASLPLHELGWQPQLHFPADAEAGMTLADLKAL